MYINTLQIIRTIAKKNTHKKISNSFHRSNSTKLQNVVAGFQFDNQKIPYLCLLAICGRKYSRYDALAILICRRFLRLVTAWLDFMYSWATTLCVKEAFPLH